MVNVFICVERKMNVKNKNQKKKYFSLASAGRTADIYIFGDITSWEWLESDVSSYTLARSIQDLDADEITVHINSYGGEVAEGLAIHNSLKNHPARVRTVCDGFACSAASVVFMAGDERVMNPASLLMVHNAWTSASGNASQLRKAADDLETISSASAEAYRARVNLSEEELKDVFPFPTTVVQSAAVPAGKAVMGLPAKYFMGLGTQSGGKIEYSDEYKFLERQRIYAIFLYGYGRAMDENAFLLLDISGLSGAALEVKVTEIPAGGSAGDTDTPSGGKA